MQVGSTDLSAKVDRFGATRGLHTPTWLFDIDTCRVLHANATACKLWQATTEEDLQRRDMSAAVAQRFKQYQADFIERDVQ